MCVPMWHHLDARVAGPNFFSTDDERYLDLLRRHRGKLVFQCLAFTAPRRIRADGVIYGNRNSVTHGLGLLFSVYTGGSRRGMLIGVMEKVRQCRIPDF